MLETQIGAAGGTASSGLDFPGDGIGRQIARQDGSAIDVKTEASPLPVNKRPRLAGKILTSN